MTDPAIFDIAPQRALTAPIAGGTDAGADAAEQFEALVIGELAKLMVSTLPTDGPFGGGHAEGIYRGLMAEHMGAGIAARGGLGLAPAVMDQLVRMDPAA